MTIALGFSCPDGMVLCTDSLESDGDTKSMVDKIRSYETQDQWGIAVASAGEADFSESFAENLQLLFTGEPYDYDKIILQLRQAINAARVTYPDLEWAALFSIFGPSPFDRKLLRVSHRSKHLAPVSHFDAFGCGAHLAKFLYAHMAHYMMGVDEAAELAVYIVMRCIEHADGCDGPISLIKWKFDSRQFTPYGEQGIAEIQARFKKGALREAMLDSWLSQTTHLKRLVPVMRAMPRGGFIKWRRAACTKPLTPTPSTSRKSKRVP